MYGNYQNNVCRLEKVRINEAFYGCEEQLIAVTSRLLGKKLGRTLGKNEQKKCL